MLADQSESLKHARVLPAAIEVRHAADGSIRARSPHQLGPYPKRITERLEYWSAAAPARTFLAERDTNGLWKVLTYGSALQRVRRIAQALVERRLSADRTVVILSGNSIEHALLALASMYAGVPYAPAAPAYSLLVRDHGTLQRLLETMRPGLVFADDGPRFEAAMTAASASGVELVTSTPAESLQTTSFAELESSTPTPSVDEAHRKVDEDTVAKVLFTSGSTGRPKGVINTQRMLCANQEQLRTVLSFLADSPPTLCDWLPWNHTFGGNHNFGIALYNGGSLYIDQGRPVPGQMDLTVANLRDVATTAYFNVPRGFEMLLPVLRDDEPFRRHFFSKCEALFFAAAGLRPDIADGMQELAIQTTGRPVPWITGLGATESAPFALCTGALISTTRHIGVPVPGVELKAAPVDGVLEARLRGPNITPGYWRDEERTRQAFDEEGFYRLGDAIAPADPDDPLLVRGFMFRGRISEDFKLSTGTWVRVGAVRARLLAELGDTVHDVVITGHGHDRIGALIFPNVHTCRILADAGQASVPDILASPTVRDAIAERLLRYNADNPGSSTAISRAILLDVPPSIDALELTDKGSISQRAVLEHRAALVERLHAATGEGLLLPQDQGTMKG